MTKDPRDVETNIARALDQSDLQTAATEALVAYGPEILRLLFGLLRQQDLAEDAYSLFCERLWKSLPEFRRRCSMRTWVYLVARYVARDVRRNAGVRKREVSLSAADVYSQVAEQVRTATMPHLRTENRTAIATLRDELPEDDRLLLVLRVERRLEWNDLALVFLDDERSRGDAAVTKREAARLRKRFQLVKERLEILARERGLLEREK